MEAAAEMPSAEIDSLHLQHLMGAEVHFSLRLDGLESGTRAAWALPEGASVLRFRLVDMPQPHDHLVLPQKCNVAVSIPTHLDAKTAIARQLEWIAFEWLKKHWSAPLAEDPDNPEEWNMIRRLIAYLYRRMRNLNAFCVICDNKHEYHEMAMPAVCQRDLCTFQYEELGLMADVASRAVQAEVLDLILIFFRACVASKRRDILLDPWPAVTDPAQPHTLAIDPKDKDGQILQDNLAKLPCPSILFRAGFSSSTPNLELPFRLFRWVMASNRTLLLQLPEAERLSFLPTQHQFIMLSDSPAKEAAFQTAKESFNGKTVFAFHGSPLSNWHSIMRKGLLAASNTQYMINAAAHGKGIYLSQYAAVSLGYSQRHMNENLGAVKAVCTGDEADHSCTSYNRFLGDPAGLICLAICEVVDSPSLKRPHGQIWVAQEPEHVSTRFLVVLRSNAITPALQGLELSAADVAQSLAQAMEFRAKRLS